MVLNDLGWSFPYALQSLALAVSISWILDFHQSRGISEKLELKQRINSLGHLQLLTSLLPYIATAVAFADGVYLDEERKLIEQIENIVPPGK